MSSPRERELEGLLDNERLYTAEHRGYAQVVRGENERLRNALQRYHDLVPALAECANECGEARLYSDLKQANDYARAVLEGRRGGV